MRIFIALDIDDEIRHRITRFMDGVRGFAPDARWVRPESLHVTLKFIGEKTTTEVEHIKNKLREVSGRAIDVAFRGYGFFPTPRSARVFWVGIQAGTELPVLAATVDDSMAALRIPKEGHSFSPHLTLARAGGRTGSPRRQKSDVPNANFQLLQQKLEALPQTDFGAMKAREFCLYESKLGPGGSKYTKLEIYPLSPQ
jgi:2'-5' RNA ligase